MTNKPFKLTQDQENTLDVLKDFMADTDAKYMVVQGDSGTGKSTLIKEMCNLLPSNRLLLTATTNKAANVVNNLLGEDVKTIHATLRLSVEFDFDTGKQYLKPTDPLTELVRKIIIIDEASFIGDTLYKLIDEATVRDCKIILVGDQYQLAPVGQKKGPVMSKIKTKYKAYLTEIVRHKGNISDLGKQFKEAIITGEFKSIETNDLDIFHVDQDKFKRLIKTAFTSKGYTSDKTRILAYTNYKVLGYNKFVRKLLNLPEQLVAGEPILTNEPCFGPGGSIIARTDAMVHLVKIGGPRKMMGIKGREVWLEQDDKYSFFLPDNPQEVRTKLKKLAKIPDWQQFFYLKKRSLDLRPMYASTVHKAQGSEYQVVFIDLSDMGKCQEHEEMARLLYVALTRATKTLVLAGKLPSSYGG